MSFRFSILIRRIFLVAPLLFMLVLSSCEKEVKINLKGGDAKIVVDGFIERGQPPVVVLTNSFSYFKKVDLSTLEGIFIHGASVKVSDGTREILLREYKLDTGFATSTYSFYSVDTADLNSITFLGESEKYYKLTVNYNGKEYSSLTKIPVPSSLDSIWTEPPAVLPTNIPGARNLIVRYNDPDTVGNRVRYFISRNNGLYLPPLNSVYDDNVINGTGLNINLSPGYDRGTDIQDFDSLLYFYQGDTISIKWASIDKSVYDFWNTLEFSLNSVGNPFGSPTQVTTNISNGALGVWAGYGTAYYKIIVP